MSETIRCTIKRMYKGCPKPDGWFGCFAHIRGAGDIKLTGKTNLPVAEGVIIDATVDPNGENAYVASDISIVTKTTRGITAYLSSLHGVSYTVAAKLVNAFGTDTVDIIKSGETELKARADEEGLSLTSAQIDSLIKGVNSIGKKNELLQFIPELANSPKLIKRIEDKFSEPIESIRQNPYCLLDVRGITFPVVDTIAVRLGTDAFSVARFGPAFRYLMQNDATGNVYLNLSSDKELSDLMYRAEKLMQLKFQGMTEFGEWLMKVVNSRKYGLITDQYTTNGLTEMHLYLESVYLGMLCIVDRISQSKWERSVFDGDAANADALINRYEYETALSPDKQTIKLEPEQRNAVKNALSSRISIITGGPGRGKTTIIDSIAYIWSHLFGTKENSNVLLLAPTGKAMDKLRTATAEKYETKTIDSLIMTLEHAAEYEEKHHKDSIASEYNKKDMLVIIDESSMIDIEKAANLFRYMYKCQFCFVGDVDQLPPIGAGCFFKDLVAASTNLPHIPVTYLVKPLRNNGTILQNADKINANDTSLKYNLTDFPFFPQNADDDDALKAIMETYIDERENTPDFTEIALLCPMRKGAIGTDSINISIQNINCPENKSAKMTAHDRRHRPCFVAKGYPIPDTIFGNAAAYTHLRIGDTVINTKNDYQIEKIKFENDDYWNGKPEGATTGLFNGDCGKIIAYIPPENPGSDDETSHSYMLIQLLDKRIVELDITAGEADSIELGYAMTVHKAQGCEYTTVIYVSPQRLLTLPRNGFASKNLVYTGITRAKKKVIVIGSKDALNLCIESNIPEKNSNLAERLRNCPAAVNTI